MGSLFFYGIEVTFTKFYDAFSCIFDTFTYYCFFIGFHHIIFEIVYKSIIQSLNHLEVTMNLRKSILILAVFGVFFTACKKDVEDQPDPNSNPTMEELVIPQDFNWETTRDIQLKVGIELDGTTQAKSKISVYKGDPQNDGVLLTVGSASQSEPLETEIRIPSHLTELYLKCEFPFGSTKVTAVDVSDNFLNHTFTKNKSGEMNTGYKSATDVGPDCSDCDHYISGSGSYNIANGETYCITDNFTGSVVFQNWNGGGTLQVCGTANMSNLQLADLSHVVVTQNGTLTIGSFNSYGENSIIVYENATFTVNNSFLTQGTIVENQGTMTINGNMTVQNLSSGEFINSGQIFVNSGSFQLNNGPVFYNYGTVEAHGTYFHLNVGSVFENEGSIILTSGSSNHLEINSTSVFTNNGTVDVTGNISINAGSTIVNNCAMICTETFAVNSGDFQTYSGLLKGAQEVVLNHSNDIQLYDGSMISTINLTMNSGGVIGYGDLNSILVTGTFTIHSTNTVSGPVESATDDLYMSSGGIPDHFINGATVVPLDEITNYIEPNSCNPDGIGSPGFADSDGDGIPDEWDDYPNDPYRAFNSYFPDEDSYASVVFEDLWPSTGDYDFNDLVLGVYGTEVTNADNELVEIYINFNVRAVGASLKNGFGWQYSEILPSEIQEVTGTVLRDGGSSYVTTSPNGTEAGQDSAVIIAVENVEDVINRVGGSMYNTVDNGLVGVSDLVEIYILFGETTPIDRDKVGPSGYNVFLIKDQDRGTEIHLPDREPTDLMTYPLGTVEDTSDPLTGRYYKTESNLPWGLLMVVPFDYPIEKVPIIEAYPDFASWAQSGGAVNQDWYLNPDPSKIWSP